MKKYLIIGIILLAFVLVGTLGRFRDKNAVEGLSVAPTPTCDLSVDGILSGINEVRSTPLVSELSLVSFAESRVVTIKNDFSHDGFEKNNQSLFSKYQWLGEDLSKGYCRNKDVITAWMNSPIHKEVMLDPRYDNIGIAINEHFVVASFGDLN